MNEGLATRVASLAESLRGASALGLRFASDRFDRERYALVGSVALELLAIASGNGVDDLQPLAASLLTHPTPFATADAAVIDDAGAVLLIRRSDNGLWAMPGGASEIGETPAQTAVREALEETGVSAEPVTLAGVFDSRLCGTLSLHHLYQFVFVCRPTAEPEKAPTHANEVLEKGWFVESDLPRDLDPGHATRLPIVFAVWRGDRPAYFDGVESAQDE